MERGARNHERDKGVLMPQVFAALALSVCLGACSPSGSDSADTHSESANKAFITNDWPLARGNPQLNGSLLDPVIQRPEIAWTFDAGSAISVDAAVYAGTVYIGSDEGTLFALSLDDGSLIWKFDSGDVIESEPAVSKDKIFFGSNNGKFFALDRNTGEEVWSIDLIDKITAGANFARSPDGTEEWLLVAGNDGALRCLRTTDGSEVWIYQTDNYINGSPAMLDDQRVIFGGCDALLHVLNVADGTAEERYETTAYIPSSVAVYQKIGYCGNYANEVIAFDYFEDGHLWTYADKSFPFFSSPAVNDKFVFIGSRDKRLHAIDRETGVGAWTFTSRGRVDSSPLAFSDAVVFGSSDGWLYALEQSAGQELWKIELGSAIIASPIFASGKLIIGTQGSILYALESGDMPEKP